LPRMDSAGAECVGEVFSLHRSSVNAVEWGGLRSGGCWGQAPWRGSYSLRTVSRYGRAREGDLLESSSYWVMPFRAILELPILRELRFATRPCIPPAREDP
jgi:hypothetical protein